MKVLNIKKEFPVFYKQHYLNFGSSGPLPMIVIKRIYSHLLLQAKEGPSSPKFMQRYLTDYVKLKKILSEFLNVSYKEIGITQNTSEGINIVLRGLNWKKGDEIITTEFEHPGLKIPLERLKIDYSVKIKTIKIAKLTQDDLLNELEKKISSKVKLIALSHVDFITGRRLPVNKISTLSKKYNIPLLVDGAQAVGSIPTDLRNLRCDFYSFPSHKWLLGPRGMGCLFIAKDRIKMVNPVFTGWCSVNDIGPGAIVNIHGKPKKNPPPPNFVNGVGRFAVSTWNTAAVAGFLECLLIFRKHFEKRLEERLNDISLFKRELLKIPRIIMLTPVHKEDSAGIISFKFRKASSFKIVQKLISLNIIVRYVPEIDCIRCCISVINKNSDLRLVIPRLKQIITE